MTVTRDADSMTFPLLVPDTMVIPSRYETYIHTYVRVGTSLCYVCVYVSCTFMYVVTVHDWLIMSCLSNFDTVRFLGSLGVSPRPK